MLKSSCCSRAGSTSLAAALCWMGNVSSPPETSRTPRQEQLSPSRVHPAAPALADPPGQVAPVQKGKQGNICSPNPRRSLHETLESRMKRNQGQNPTTVAPTPEAQLCCSSCLIICKRRSLRANSRGTSMHWQKQNLTG